MALVTMNILEFTFEEMGFQRTRKLRVSFLPVLYEFS